MERVQAWTRAWLQRKSTLKTDEQSWLIGSLIGVVRNCEDSGCSGEWQEEVQIRREFGTALGDE